MTLLCYSLAEELPDDANVYDDDHDDSNDASDEENSDVDDFDSDDNDDSDDDGDGSDEDNNKDVVGNVGSEEIIEEQELPQQIHGLRLEEQEEHLKEQDQYKTKIHE